MTVTIKYLASLAEELGKTQDVLTLSDDGMTVAEAWQQLNPDKAIKANTICAINFIYAQLSDIVPEHSELAFFPPVTGG